MSEKKSKQLGIPFGTAQNRLRQDLFWMLLQESGRSKCCVCNEEMSRDTFSVEHIIPWQDSEDPNGLFFNLENVDFSHRACNYASARRYRSPCGTRNKYQNGCRCEDCVKAQAEYLKGYYTTERRQQQYLRTGK